MLLVRTHDGFPVDIALGAMQFEEAAIERSSNVDRKFPSLIVHLYAVVMC